MKKIFLLIAISIMSFGCDTNATNTIEYYEGVNIYNLRGINKITFPFIRLNPYVSIKRTSDSIIIKTHRVKCPTTEIYVKNEMNVWESNIVEKSHTIGKRYIPPYLEGKYIHNDTIIKYINVGMYYKLDYKPNYFVISIETKQNRLEFYQPNFSKPTYSFLKKSDIDKLMQNSIIIKKIEKSFIGGNYYEDVISTNHMKDSIYNAFINMRILTPIKNYSLSYKLDSVSEYFLERDRCSSFKNTELDYKAYQHTPTSPASSGSLLPTTHK